ncbi:uncharacterized protein [Cicer arietinum]|uniref:Uncharacterized protein LOC105852079 n=1 Tax=Cicer arietinum TaxID=3827 RepID=A0A1S3E7V9_CICAR|nr:uncharacterized protein LOC105852079 [Cicer arietinum]
MEAIQMQATATHNLVQQMAMRRDSTANANRVFYDFLKLQPSTFQGSHNPSEAQAWLDEIKKAFEVVPCTEEQKVAFAAHLLKGGAEYWWRSAKTYLQTQGTHMNWEHFEVAFLDKYYPKSARRQKELEFVHLQQGDMSVAEYVVKFEELARFSPHAQYALTEE